ncbi:MAG: 50S ribosomal protein L9 [bacterium]|nr:50S ribosomal protein L9 [bacterium]
MKVMLLADVANVGDEGDIVEVSDGHARTILFPQHLAVPATETALAEVAARAEEQRQAAEHELTELQRIAEVLDGCELIVSVKVNANGTLSSVIDAARIAAQLAADGTHIDAAWVRLDAPIEEPGEYDIRFSMPHGIEAEGRVIVEEVS